MTTNEQLAFRTFVLLLQEEAEMKLEVEQASTQFQRGAHWAFMLMKGAITNDDTAECLADLLEHYKKIDVSKGK